MCTRQLFAAVLAVAVACGCAQKGSAPSDAGGKSSSEAPSASSRKKGKKKEKSNPMPSWLLDEIDDSLAKGDPIVPEAQWKKLIAAAKAVKALPKTATNDDIVAAVKGAGFADMDEAAKAMRPAAKLVETFMGLAMSTQTIIATHKGGPAAAMLKPMADDAKARLRETVKKKKLTRADLEFLSTHSEDCGLVLGVRIALAMKGLYSEE